MDLALYGRVLWRFRLIVFLGLIIAVLLAVLAVARPELKNGSLRLTYRDQQGWTSTSRVWVTQAGFPLGRSVYDQYLPAPKSTDVQIPKFSDPTRFSSLATVFTALVPSDGVEQIMRRKGPIDGEIGASQPTLPGNGSIVLPFVDVFATASSPERAQSLSALASRSLISYVEKEQQANNIPTDKRVVLQVVSAAQPAVLTKARPKSRPVIVLLATLLVVIGLTFFLENLRPRVQPVSIGSKTPSAPAADRLSA